ncbi:alpha/beta hydrolase [Enterovirga sp. CN4-39]|uniref:alpha/beta hydrolase n=1 Tax=Enterovirga sp. CN4-39 TaxID=3400910 RepID=UPI003C016574
MTEASPRIRPGIATPTIRMELAEKIREFALRDRIAAFWGDAVGAPRDIYDTFIAACPRAGGVAERAVNCPGVDGWWMLPERSEPGEAILFLHGGGYVQGSARAYRGFVSQIVGRAGIPALVIDYPLAPEATLPAAPDAAAAAYEWIGAQGFDRVAVVGDSAGGGLALVTLAQLGNRSRRPRAGVVFSPWADLAFTGASMRDPAVSDPLIAYEYLQDCARKYVGSMSPCHPLASPLLGDVSGLPPILIQVGTDERLLDDARQYADRAHEAGVEVELEIYAGMHHAFQLDVAALATSRLALDRAAAFIRRAMKADQQVLVRAQVEA